VAHLYTDLRLNDWLTPGGACGSLIPMLSLGTMNTIISARNNEPIGTADNLQAPHTLSRDDWSKFGHELLGAWIRILRGHKRVEKGTHSGRWKASANVPRIVTTCRLFSHTDHLNLIG
jgi:hypothetical protein